MTTLFLACKVEKYNYDYMLKLLNQECLERERDRDREREGKGDGGMHL